MASLNWGAFYFAHNIQDLSEEQQKAINFLVAKGYFALDNGMKFNPYDTLKLFLGLLPLLVVVVLY